jgi:hypothetical protein
MRVFVRPRQQRAEQLWHPEWMDTESVRVDFRSVFLDGSFSAELPEDPVGGIQKGSSLTFPGETTCVREPEKEAFIRQKQSQTAWRLRTEEEAG